MKKKSTYSLLINANSEEKGRSIFEIAVSSLVVLCMALSFWAFASSPLTVPSQANAKRAATPTSVIAQAVAEQPAFASSN